MCPEGSIVVISKTLPSLITRCTRVNVYLLFVYCTVGKLYVLVRQEMYHVELKQIHYIN
jgi:hypothetical protein